MIGGATLWVLRDRPRAEYKGVARFFAYLSQPERGQAAWHQNTGYLPITRAAFELTRAAGLLRAQSRLGDLDRGDRAAMPPTENSKGMRLGFLQVPIRGMIEDELEQAFAGKKPAQTALESAVERGNKICCGSSGGAARSGRLSVKGAGLSTASWPGFVLAIRTFSHSTKNVDAGTNPGMTTSIEHADVDDALLILVWSFGVSEAIDLAGFNGHE